MFAPTLSRRRLAWIAAPAVALLFAAGCGDDDSSDTTTTIELDTTTSADDTTSTTADDTNTDGATDTDDTTDDSVDDLVEAGEDAQAELEQALRDAGLNSLASAIGSVDLSEVLGDDEFTVFAPDDDAFLALDSGDLADMLADPDEVLDLLRTHVVVGERLTAEDLAAAGTVDTASGTALSVSGDADSLTVEGATVTSSEEVGNGIFHVVDQVLLVGATS